MPRFLDDNPERHTAGNDAWLAPDGRDPLDDPAAIAAERHCYLAFRNGDRRRRRARRDAAELMLIRLAIVVTIGLEIAFIVHLLHRRGIL